MATHSHQRADQGFGLITSYAFDFDVDLDAGLNDAHLETLTDLLRTHADCRQLRCLLREIEILLHQQSAI